MRGWRRSALALLALAASISACGDTASPPAKVVTVDFICESDPQVFPEFDGQQLRPMVVHDVSGTFTGCRWIVTEEVTAILDTLEPPLPEPMQVGQVHVTQAAGRDNTLILFWAVRSCDSDATVSITPGVAVPNVQITQRRFGACGPGTGPTWLQLAARSSVDVATVSAALRYSDR